MKKILWFISSNNIYSIYKFIQKNMLNYEHIFLYNDISKNVNIKELENIKNIYKISNFIPNFNSIFTILNPDIIIFGADTHYIERTIIKLSITNKIKTFLLQEGNIHLYNRVYKNIDNSFYKKINLNKYMYLLYSFFSLIKQIGFFKSFYFLKEVFSKNKYDKYGLSGIDSIIVYGEAFKKILEKKGVKSNIFICGNPKYDKTINEEKFQELPKRVLFLDGPHYKDKYMSLNTKKFIFKKITNLLKKEGYNIVIRPHPREIKKVYDKEQISRIKNINEDLQKSEIVIAIDSTAGLDAIIKYNKKLLVLSDYLNESSIFYNLKIGYKIKNIKNISFINLKKINFNKTNEYISRINCSNNGIKEIINIIENN